MNSMLGRYSLHNMQGQASVDSLVRFFCRLLGETRMYLGEQKISISKYITSSLTNRV